MKTSLTQVPARIHETILNSVISINSKALFISKLSGRDSCDDYMVLCRNIHEEEDVAYSVWILDGINHQLSTGLIFDVSLIEALSAMVEALCNDY